MLNSAFVESVEMPLAGKFNIGQPQLSSIEAARFDIPLSSSPATMGTNRSCREFPYDLAEIAFSVSAPQYTGRVVRETIRPNAKFYIG